jgi:hypothetical protein
LERSETALPQGRGGMAPAAWALALMPAAMLGVLLLRAVWDVDIFWQLRLGELILAAGGPVVREPFAATHLGEPLPSIAWLGQAGFAAVREAFGWTGLRLFDALCWCGGFWLIAAACRRQGATVASLALGLSLGFIAALPAASIRPQSYAALCFGGLLALLKLELRTWQTVATGTVLLVAWQNLHPSASIAAVALGAHAFGGWLAWWRDREREPPWASTILVPLAVACLFATPDGLNVLATSARNAKASMAVGASEWLPLWIPDNYTNAVPVVVVALVALRSAWRSGRVSWADLMVMLALLALTVTAYRFVLFWAIAAVPVLAPRSSARRVRGEVSTTAVFGALLLVAVATPLAWPTHFSSNLPLAAVAKLRQTDARGTVFTEPEFAGVLIDAGYPRWHVSYDGRYYRYTDEEWARYGDVLAGNFRLRRIERMYRPAAFVLRPSHSTALCAELDRPNSGWRRIWSDEGAAVWVPRKPRP